MVAPLQLCLCAAMAALYRKIVAIPASNNELSFFNSPHTGSWFQAIRIKQGFSRRFSLLFYPIVMRTTGLYNYCSGGNNFRYRWYFEHNVDYLNAY